MHIPAGNAHPGVSLGYNVPDWAANPGNVGHNGVSPPEDVIFEIDSNYRKEFKEYLVTNLLLYFDKFENEIQPNVEEPTNQAYDSASSQQPAGGEEEGEDTLDLEI